MFEEEKESEAYKRKKHDDVKRCLLKIVIDSGLFRVGEQ